ncbi:FYVE zinc finger domain-containing protein [Facilibium subflavum]|uniref:FYVE zinc finger domain-containing protein n=1 Tax=Facilibium subflavum TaxID=2219058 RepID=UPI000E64B5A7|nr:FYVE zinc finger domain-containing protein [Facilibium subflavum]
MHISDYIKLKKDYTEQIGMETGGLIQCSEGYDNNFRDLGSKKIIRLRCSYQGIFETPVVFDEHYCGDFVWDGGDEITVFDFFSSGGHPALTQEGVTDCAGIVKQDTFFFHSGHFKPKARDIIPFMFRFIDNSLDDYQLAEEKQSCLTFLCEEMLLELYYDQSRQTTEMTFLSLCEHVLKYGNFKKIPHSSINLEDAPLRRYSNYEEYLIYTRQQDRKKITQERRQVPHSELIERRWQADNSSDNCYVCAQRIRGSLFTTNKHHCRVCGQIICGNCYKTADVPNPLSGKGVQTKTGVHRTKVCNPCVQAIQRAY